LLHSVKTEFCLVKHEVQGQKLPDIDLPPDKTPRKTKKRALHLVAHPSIVATRR
tara:strand:- start:266 stop:427 length:162 start_codon:yes stop_codon:yes gene_type:complete